MSVVVATYDRAQLLPRPLESLERQTHPALEIVVVDDGSTDETARVVEAFHRRSSRRVIYHHQSNAGCAAARNAGIAQASGEWLLFLDSDDALEPCAVEALLSTAVGTGADFVYSPALEIQPDGSARVNEPVAAGHPEALAEAHFFHTNVRNGAVLFRAEAVRSLDGFESTLRHNEDSHLLQRMAIRFTAAYCDTPTVRVHGHAGSKSRDRPAIHRALLRSAELVLEEFPGFRQELGGRAEARISELQRALARALVLRGDFDGAANLAPVSIGLLERVCIALRTAGPIRAVDWLGRRLAAGARFLRPARSILRPGSDRHGGA